MPAWKQHKISYQPKQKPSIELHRRHYHLGKKQDNVKIVSLCNKRNPTNANA